MCKGLGCACVPRVPPTRLLGCVEPQGPLPQAPRREGASSGLTVSGEAWSTGSRTDPAPKPHRPLHRPLRLPLCGRRGPFLQEGAPQGCSTARPSSPSVPRYPLPGQRRGAAGGPCAALAPAARRAAPRASPHGAAGPEPAAAEPTGATEPAGGGDRPAAVSPPGAAARSAGTGEDAVRAGSGGGEYGPRAARPGSGVRDGGGGPRRRQNRCSEPSRPRGLREPARTVRAERRVRELPFHRCRRLGAIFSPAKQGPG